MESSREKSETGVPLLDEQVHGEAFVRKVYVTPALKVFGLVRDLTAAGSSAATECGNNGAKKKC
jgi:hypothetical protein